MSFYWRLGLAVDVTEILVRLLTTKLCSVGIANPGGPGRCLVDCDTAVCHNPLQAEMGFRARSLDTGRLVP